jgi:polysaccharide export outer membrane protein
VYTEPLDPMKHQAPIPRTLPVGQPLLRALQLSTILLFTSLGSAGCLRYTPSHSELRDKHNDSSNPITQLGGADEFEKYERNLGDRRNTLIAQRSHLLSGAAQGGGHPVGPGDELQVDVFGFQNLTASTGIASDGSIILPLVGRVSVGGKPLEQIQEEVGKRYAHYIRSPQVHVALKTPVTARVSVIGEVHKPGAYPLTRKGMCLTEVLSDAGGRTPNASSRIILLPAPRITEHAVEASTAMPQVSFVSTQDPADSFGIEIDIEELTGGVNQRPLLIPLLPGDTVIVPEAGTYEVDGEVTQPGSFKLTSRTSVIGAIAAARGLTYAAAVNNVEVIRDTGNGKKALITLDLEEVGLRGGQDVRLRSGDLVRVPSEPGRFFRRQIVQTINGLFNGVGVNQRMN